MRHNELHDHLWLRRPATADKCGGERRLDHQLCLHNRTSASANGVATTCSYNEANQVVGWTYDAAGNLTDDPSAGSGQAGTSFSYDALNRLLTQGSTSNTYNGDGVLVAQTIGSSTISYTQDVVAPLSQILSDPSTTLRAGGTATYVYGHERLFGTVGATRTWYMTDALGSLRQTFDDTGVMQQFATYDAWGVPQTALIAPFGFTGELQQGENVYLRARWYDAGRGSFSVRDPFAGWAETPYSLMPYQYGYSNPALWTDPSGRITEPPLSLTDRCLLDQLPRTLPGGSAPSAQSIDTDPVGAINEERLVVCLGSTIKRYAERHAMPGFGFTRDVTAAFIGAIIMMETGTTNTDELYGNWPGSRVNNAINPWADSSVGIANLRPSVVLEIFECYIPLGEKDISSDSGMYAALNLTYITKQEFLQREDRNWLAGRIAGVDMTQNYIRADIALISRLLDDMEFAIDLIGANMQRGIIRATRNRIQPSIFNTATWHNAGVQGVPGIRKATSSDHDVLGYGMLVALTLVDEAAHLLRIPPPPQSLRYNTAPNDPDRDEAALIRSRQP